MDQDTGFTLIEMMITLAITSIVMMFLYSVHNNLTISTANQKLKIQMQQNLRGGFSVMEKEIRMAGYDPEGTGHFTIMDVGYRLKNKTSSVNINSSVNQGYSSSLVFAYDRDHDGGCFHGPDDLPGGPKSCGLPAGRDQCPVQCNPP